MKKLVLVILAVVVTCGISACSCTAEKRAAADIEETHKLILPEYTKYVEADAALTPERKADRKKLVESLQRLTGALRKSLED